jgi:hydroxymethylbilane synthase
MKIRIGTRGSKLGIAYAEKVCKELPYDTEIITIKTKGDLNPDTPVSEIGGKGIFCSAIEKELLNGNIDIGVHSLKDMPGDVETPGLVVNSVLKRNSAHDVIVGKVNFGCTIGTSSPRRIAQLKDLYNNLNIIIKPIRGNIDTRLEKLDSGEYDAIVLAEAGLQTLNINRTWIKLPIVPAIGQGIIALQTKADNEVINEIVKKINHKTTYAQAQLERALLKGIGGDCTTKVAAHATGSNPITLKAMYYD